MKVIEISELDKGYLVTVVEVEQNRMAKGKKMFAFDNSEKEVMLDMIKLELRL